MGVPIGVSVWPSRAFLARMILIIGDIVRPALLRALRALGT